MDIDLFASLDKLSTKLEELVEKTKLKDIHICYSNLKELNQIKAKFNKIPDRIFNGSNKSKEETIAYIDRKIISNIEVIINESYDTFMHIKEDEGREDELKKLVFDIQNSSFYNTEKDRFKVKKMEIELIMVEAEEDGNYVKAKKKLIEINKIVYDFELKNLIKEHIDECENNYITKERQGIRDLLLQQNYEKVYEIYEKLFNDYPNQLHLIYKEYLSTLSNVIIKKIERNEVEIVEIEKYKNFLNK